MLDKTIKFEINCIPLFNGALSVIISVLLGIILRIFGLPYWLIGGIIAVCATIIEHYLTLYPNSITKYVFKGDKDD